MVLALSRTPKKAAIPPSDAATLIIVRFDGPSPRILMGQRHEAHVFMPNKYVFPGGRMEASDKTMVVAREGLAATMQKLMLKRVSRAKARGLLIAAIRETFEETGLFVGCYDEQQAYDLSGLTYFARAITPPGRSRRFDSRFFVVDGRKVANLDAPKLLDSPELLALNWVTLNEAEKLDLPTITRDILVLLAPFLAQNKLPPADCPVTFHHKRGKAWVVDILPHRKT